MSTAKYRKKLGDLQKRQEKLIGELLKMRPILRGTVSQVYTRCGKPNCWCAASPEGHPHLRITWSQKGKMITRKVPSAELSRIRDLTENYRRFRSLRRKLSELNIQIKQMLDFYQTALIEDSRTGMSFLGFRTKNAAQQTKRLQKTRKSDKKEKS